MRMTPEDMGYRVYLAPDSPDVLCPIPVSLTMNPGFQRVIW